MPLALWSTRFGAPNSVVRFVVRTVGNIIRAFPDILWALLFVSAVGIGALPGLLSLFFFSFFFSIAVVTKLTADTLDGIDAGPLEAANASGAGHTQMLRTAVVPQILPAYASYSLYAFELNLRASSVIGLVGAGGVGERIRFFVSQNNWEAVWGIVVMFVIVVFIVDRISTLLRRRLV
jgi:phosphonate transport system permease protein